jgi:hypothetical protein
MPNPYYNYNDDFVPFSKVPSQRLDDQFEAIEDGFDKLGPFDGINSGSILGGDDTGTVNTVVVDNDGPDTLQDFHIVTWRPVATNTGPSTLALNGNTPLPITRNNGLPLEAGDLIEGVMTAAIHDVDESRYTLIGSTHVQTIGRPPVKTITANYTLTAADEGYIIRCNSSSDITVTIPPHSTAALPNGFLVHLYRYGTGEVIVSAGAGVALRTAIGAKARNRYSSVSPSQVTQDDWLLLGDAKV